jgi:hypothetical protein
LELGAQRVGGAAKSLESTHRRPFAEVCCELRKTQRAERHAARFHRMHAAPDGGRITQLGGACDVVDRL